MRSVTGNKVEGPARWPAKAGDYPGCSDGGCVFGHPGGMHTNGGCHCLESMRDPHDRVKVRGAIQRLLLVAAEPEANPKVCDSCAGTGMWHHGPHGSEPCPKCRRGYGVL